MADCALAEDLAPPAGVSRAGLLSSWLLRTMTRGGRGRHDYGCVLLTGATALDPAATLGGGIVPEPATAARCRNSAEQGVLGVARAAQPSAHSRGGARAAEEILSAR